MTDGCAVFFYGFVILLLIFLGPIGWTIALILATIITLTNIAKDFFKGG